MTTKQTIDGVPRELLRWMDDFINDGLELSKEEASISAQLRALLDAPAKSDYLQSCEAAHKALEPSAVKGYQNKINHLKQLLRNVRATLHFSPEDVLAIDAALREDGE